jgi:hypothetical protein
MFHNFLKYHLTLKTRLFLMNHYFHLYPKNLMYHLIQMFLNFLKYHLIPIYLMNHLSLKNQSFHLCRLTLMIR